MVTLLTSEYAFSVCHELAAVVIPEGVTEIEEYAFWDCSALASVTLPSTIEKIKNRAFENCRVLATVTIPDSVSAISFDVLAFMGCVKLPLASQAALRKLGYKGSF